MTAIAYYDGKSTAAVALYDKIPSEVTTLHFYMHWVCYMTFTREHVA